MADVTDLFDSLDRGRQRDFLLGALADHLARPGPLEDPPEWLVARCRAFAGDPPESPEPQPRRSRSLEPQKESPEPVDESQAEEPRRALRLAPTSTPNSLTSPPQRGRKAAT